MRAKIAKAMRILGRVSLTFIAYLSIDTQTHAVAASCLHMYWSWSSVVGDIHEIHWFTRATTIHAIQARSSKTYFSSLFPGSQHAERAALLITNVEMCTFGTTAVWPYSFQCDEKREFPLAHSDWAHIFHFLRHVFSLRLSVVCFLRCLIVCRARSGISPIRDLFSTCSVAAFALTNLHVTRRQAQIDE